MNILDVISINKAVLGKETFSQEQNQAADLDGNGKVDANEWLLLSQTYCWSYRNIKCTQKFIPIIYD